MLMRERAKSAVKEADATGYRLRSTKPLDRSLGSRAILADAMRRNREICFIEIDFSMAFLHS
jgi:hypothetical protein